MVNVSYHRMVGFASMAAIVAVLAGAALIPVQPAGKPVTVHTKNRVYEGTLESAPFEARLTFNGQRENLFIREGADERKYLISAKEDGYCFQVDGNALLQMPQASAGCKRNK
jgi:hypothetical protein